MRALVTGGCGFIGSHLCGLLLADGHQVVVIDNMCSGKIDNVAEFENSKHFRFIQADITDYDAIKRYFASVDWVFHLAGMADIVPSIENPKSYFDTNVAGTLNVLRASHAAGVKRLVYAASSSCYGIPIEYPTPERAQPDPRYPYALTKYLGEQLVLHWDQVYRLPSVSLRLFNVYGPRSRTTGTYGAVVHCRGKW
jgi:UDP-glucose 4-epimerase